jgi:glycosyltransferase 2 family protein
MLRWLRHPLVWLPVSVALLGIVVWRSRLWEAAAVLGAIDPRPVLVALIVGQATPLLWAIRSQQLLAGLGHHVSLRALAPMTSFANTVNNLTPGSGGELIRLYLFRVRHGVDYSIGAAVILIERFGGLGYLSLSAAVLWFAWLWHWPIAIPLALLLLIAGVPLIVYALGVRPVATFARLPVGRAVRWGRWNDVADGLVRTDASIAQLLTDPLRVAGLVVVTGAVFVVSTIQLLLVATAFGLRLDPVAAWGAIGLATTAGVLSFLPFGLGAADLALVALLGVAGVAPAEAAAVAFGYRLVGTLPYAIEGVASYAWLSARLPELATAGRLDARDVAANDGQA